MSIQIKLKNSVVQDSTPSTSDLPEVGELAVNANINSIGGFMRASDNTIVKIFGPGSLSTPTATTTVSGISELATNSETTTGTATNRVVTPAGLNAVTVAERTTSNNNYVAKAGSTMTGVLTATAGSNSAPAINFGDSDSGIFGGTNTVSLAAGGTTRLTADTGVSITGALSVSNNISTSGGQITCGVHGTSGIQMINDGTFGTIQSADLVLRTAATERARLDTSGRLLVGTSTARSPQGITASLQVEGTDAPTSSISITRNSANTNSANLIFNKSRGAAVGSDTVVQNNDTLGIIGFAGNDGTDSNNAAAQIAALVDGTPGSNDMPGRLEFKTTADGAATPTTRLTIDSSGNVRVVSGDIRVGDDIDSNAGTQTISVGSVSSGAGGIGIFGNPTNGNSFVQFGDGTAAADQYRGFLNYQHASDSLIFGSAGSERMRISSSGNVGINTSSPATGYGLDILGLSGYDDVFRITGSGTNIGPRINLTPTGTGTNRINATANNLQLQTGGSAALTIDTSQRVGIGTSSPAAKLQVAGSAHITAPADSLTTDALQLSFSSPEGHLKVKNSSGAPAANLAFHTTDVSGNTNRVMHLRHDGKIGIGTTAPDVMLDIRANDPGIQLVDTSGTSTYGNIDFVGDSLVLTSRGGSSSDGIIDFRRYDGTTIDNSMRIDSSGNVGIGTTTIGNESEHKKLIISGAAGTGAGILEFQDTSNNTDAALFSDNGNLFIVADRDNTTSSSSIRFRVDGSNERMRIDSSGNVGIGVTTIQDRLHIAFDGNTNVQCECTGTGSGANAGINVKSADGGDFFVQTGNAVSGGLRVYDAGASAERMRIDSNGRVFLGNGDSSPASSFYDDLIIFNTTAGTGAGITLIANATNGFSALDFADTAAGGRGRITYSHADDDLRIDVNGAERMRINGSGKVGIGTSVQDHLLHVKGDSNVLKIDHTTSGDTTAIFLRHARGNLSGFSGKAISFRGSSDTETGSIRIALNSTSYNTSSDYRLKENATAISDGITRLKTLKPYRFNWKADASTKVDGFFAHEVTAVPEAITGTKDEVDSDNNPVYQGIDQSKLVPLLVAAVQELIGKVEALEAA